MNGRKLAYLRKQRGLTQEKLAELLGTSKITVSFWERDARVPEVDMLIKIADFFDVAVDYLLDRTEIPNIYKNTTVLADGTVIRKPEVDNDALEALVSKIVQKILDERGYRPHS